MNKLGNPNLKPGPGRPIGSRNKLSTAFLDDLYDDYKEHGKEAIALVREEATDKYLKLVADLVPKETHIKIDPLDEMDHGQLKSEARRLHQILSLTGILEDIEEAETLGRPGQVIEVQAVSEAEGISCER